MPLPPFPSFTTDPTHLLLLIQVPLHPFSFLFRCPSFIFPLQSNNTTSFFPLVRHPPSYFHLVQVLLLNVFFLFKWPALMSTYFSCYPPLFFSLSLVQMTIPHLFYLFKWPCFIFSLLLSDPTLLHIFCYYVAKRCLWFNAMGCTSPQLTHSHHLALYLP